MDIFYIVALVVLFIWNQRLQSDIKGLSKAIISCGDIAGAGLDNHECRLKTIEEKE